MSMRQISISHLTDKNLPKSKESNNNIADSDIFKESELKDVEKDLNLKEENKENKPKSDIKNVVFNKFLDIYKEQ